MKSEINEMKRAQLHLLAQINDKLDRCEIGSQKYQELKALQSRVKRNILKSGAQIAASNVAGPGELAVGAGLAAICVGLFGIPVIP